MPHYWEHVQWVWGKKSFDEFMAFVPAVTLDDVISRDHSALSCNARLRR